MQRFSTARLVGGNPRRTGATLVEATRGLGLRIDGPDLELARTLLGGISIDEVLHSDTPPDEIVEAWGALISSTAHSKQEYSVALLLALAAMTDLFVHDAPRLGHAIQLRGWNTGRTASEAAMRLFGTEFNIGRRLVPNRDLRVAGRALLVEAIATSSSVNTQFYSPPSRVRYHGMRGVAYLLIARGEFSPSKLALLEAASADLAESRRLGDHSAQHAEYEIEALLRRNQIGPSPMLLDQADALLKQAGLVSRRLVYNAGDIGLTRGVQAMDEARYEDALTQYQAAIDAYSSGLRIARRRFDMDDDDIRAKRGYARLRAQYASSKLALETSAEELDGIVNDLECGEADFFSGLSPLPEALLWRAAHFRTSGDLDRAIQDLIRAIESSPHHATAPEAINVLGRARCQLADCRLAQSLEKGDIAGVESALLDLLKVDAAFDPSIPLMANGVRRIVLDRGHRSSAPLIREVASNMRLQMNRIHCIGATRAFAASYTAGVLFRLGDLIDETELRVVCALYTEVIEESADPPAPEVLALAGDAKLRLAKLLLTSGHSFDEAVLLLEDAVELFEAGINAVDRASDAYDEQVAHSKLGEALIRLASLTDDIEATEAAAHHLERSHVLGNGAPELFGLLGDCYYRIGRARKDIAGLRRAADLKELARDRANEMVEHRVSLRENWSLTARIEESMWHIRGDIGSMGAAVRSAVRAHAADPEWPWPMFQLAALRRAFGEEMGHIVSTDEAVEGANAAVNDALRQGTVEALEVLGAELAVKSDEFRRRVLGGRTQVYVLDDEHGLLSATIVLKRNTKKNAERESADALALTHFLNSSGADPQLLVARPIAIVPLDDSHAVYAMQHMKGRELGALVVGDRHISKTNLLEVYKRTVDFLAWFHAWSWKQRIGTGPKSPAELKVMAESISLLWKQAGIGMEHVDELRELLGAVLPSWAVHLRKKDAHPENWLVTRSGEIILIDLESTKCLPVLFDFWQLVDDYPALGVDADGIRQRRELLAQYHRYLTERIPDLRDKQLVEGDPWIVSCGFLLFRVSFGLARLALQARGANDATTSSVRRSGTLRREHYVKLLGWLAGEGPIPKIAECARHVLMMVKRLAQDAA